MKKQIGLFILALLGSFFPLLAQENEEGASKPNPEVAVYLRRPRYEDHFWRQRVVNRIDLTEKINSPLIYKESAFYTDNEQTPERSGLIMTLLKGLKDGEYTAYDPDSLTEQMSYEDVIRMFTEFEGNLDAESDLEGEAGDDKSGFDDFNGADGFEMNEDKSGAGEDPFADPFGAEGDLSSSTDSIFKNQGAPNITDFSPLETVIQFVEDRIFDKVRSDMIYDIQHLELIWTDPGGVLPERKLCTFQYDEVLGALEKAQWKNRFNDAEVRTLREIFDLRLFHSYIINVGGQGVRTKEEAEYRRQKLVEFEHHLWSY